MITFIRDKISTKHKIFNICECYPTHLLYYLLIYQCVCVCVKQFRKISFHNNNNKVDLWFSSVYVRVRMCMCACVPWVCEQH